MKVVWTEEASADLAYELQSVNALSKTAAKQLGNDLVDASLRLGDFPLSGRAVPELGFVQLRELIVGRFRLLYHVLADRVEILAVHPAAVP